MEFNEYQKLAKTTAIYPKEYKLVYPALGLAGEAGEVAEKIKKLIRDTNGMVTETFRESIKKELGDVLWYISAISSDLDISLNEVAETNYHKLKSRQDRGALSGSGDNR